MGITKFNKSETLFTNTDKYEDFKTLEELYKSNGNTTKYIVQGVYTFKSVYGEGCFIKSDGYNITLPTHLTSTIKEIRNDSESIQQINNGMVYIELYTYTLPEKYPDTNFYSVNFIVE